VYNQTFLSQEDLVARLQAAGLDGNEITRICGAYDMAEDVHRVQKRMDGSPYFWHVSRVAKILLDELKITDPDLICTALLHDALEDSDLLSPAIIEYNFGPYVAYLVQTLTKDYKADPAHRERIDKEYVDRIRQSTEDARVIKFADRLDNSRCLSFNLKRNPIRYINETASWYFPMAIQSTNPHLHYLMKEIQKEQNKYLG
jgi:(p)ppGpp synthase/HD superfamily hydrolase